MDNKTCKGCFLIIDSSASHCPSCGKPQSYKSLWNTVIIILGISLLYLAILNSTETTYPVTVREISPSTPAVTPTLTTITPITNLIITAPSAADGWTKIHPGLYARRVDNRSDCFEMGTGIEYCAGQPVEYYSTNGRWIVAWENSWSKTREEIIPGEANLVYVPRDATNIHWEWGVPGCNSLFIEECLGN